MDKILKILEEEFKNKILTDDKLKQIAESIMQEIILLEDNQEYQSLSAQTDIWLCVYDKIESTRERDGSKSYLSKLEMMARAANEILQKQPPTEKRAVQRECLIRGITGFNRINEKKYGFSKNKENKIPYTTSLIIEKINILAEQLNTNKESLNNDEIFTLENIMKKRIPEVLAQYLKIAPEQIDNLKNSGEEDVLKLMEDTLNNYKTKLDEIALKINISKIRDLRVSNNYSKNLVSNKQ